MTRPRIEGADLGVGLLLFVAISLVFAPVRHHDFVDYDDPEYVVNNVHLDEPLTGRSVLHELTHVHAAYWIPLTWLSYRVDATLFGRGEAGSFLLVNVFWHLLNTWLLFALLRRLGRNRGVAAGVALLFAIHPLHVESVAWVTERKDVLSTFFWMTGCLLYAGRGANPLRPAREIGVFLCMLLGLMSKPSVVMFPIALLLLDFWPRGRFSGDDVARQLREAVTEKIPLFGLSVAGAMIVMNTQRAGGGTTFASALDPAVRAATSVQSVVLYLRDVVWPWRLSPIYPHPLEMPPLWVPALAALFIAALTVLAVRARKQAPWWTFGWAWFLVMLLPVLGIVGVGMQARADRWMYLPLIGLGLAVAEALRQLVLQRPVLRMPVVLLCAAVLGVFGLKARAQVGIWENTETLFTRAIELDDNNWFAHHRLAVLWRTRNDGQRAEAHYLRTVTELPEFSWAQGELADVILARGDEEAAREIYENVLRTGWGDPQADLQLGLVLLRIGRTTAALELLEHAVARDPASGDARAGLALAAARSGDPDTAREQRQKAVQLGPETREGRIALAWLLATAPEPELRDPSLALQILDAEPSDVAPDAWLLDARAAALAADERLGEAFRLEQQAAELARADERPVLAETLRQRGLDFLQGRPFRELRRDPS